MTINPATCSATELTQALVRIASENPNGNEEQIALFIRNWLQSFGVEVIWDEIAPQRCNVVARLRGSSDLPALAYLGHMDTVPAGAGWTQDPFGGEIIDGKLYGRGACDMKSGLAAIMIAFREVVKSVPAPKRDFLMCATIDEEGPTMMGAVRLIENGLVDANSLVVATEPTANQLITAGKGVMWYRLEAQGKMAHAGNPYVGADANHALALALAACKDTFAALTHDHAILGKAFLTIGQMSGGAKTNVVPDLACAEIDTRLVPPMTTAETETMLRQAATAAAAAVKGASLSLTPATIDRPPVEADHDSPVVQAFVRALEEVTGSTPAYGGFAAYTDAGIIAAQTGNRHCILYGPGHLEQAHTADEYVLVDEIEEAARVLTRAATELVGDFPAGV